MDWTPEAHSAFEATVQTTKERLLQLADRHLHPLLRQRLTAEDILQEMLATALKSPAFFSKASEVPIYFKLRRLLFQTLADAERHHLKSRKRDLYREIPLDLEQEDPDAPTPRTLVAEISSPFTKVARQERYSLLSTILSSLPANDRRIIVLRHFDGCTNAECASILNLSEKAASLRYVRALTRLQERLARLTEFNI